MKESLEIAELTKRPRLLLSGNLTEEISPGCLEGQISLNGSKPLIFGRENVKQPSIEGRAVEHVVWVGVPYGSDDTGVGGRKVVRLHITFELRIVASWQL